MSDEARTIERAAAGDASALGALAEQHRPTVVRIARHMLGDDAEAEDIAQDVLIRMGAALPGFRGDAALSTWLYRVTLNLCHDRLRRRRRHGEPVTLDAVGEAAAPQPPIDHRLDRRRRSALVRAAIDRLPDLQREAIMLRYLQELTYEEIARITGAPIGTIASRVFRALERLGPELESEQWEVLE